MSQEQQLLMAILDEIRTLRQSVEQQALLSAHASRSQEYGLLYERFRHLLLPMNTLGGAPDITNMWITIRGTDGWREHLSPDQLGLLLCRDERLVYNLRRQQCDVPSGFVEEVLSRLPRLEQCCMRGMRCPTNFSTLQTVPGPFPALRSMDLQETAVTDSDLLYLSLLCPNLQSVNVSNCPNISAEGINAVHQRKPSLVVIPATGESKLLDDAQRDLDKKLLDFKSTESNEEYDRLVQQYGSHFVGFERESVLDKKLLALWMALGGARGWRRHLRPAQLTLLLSRLTSVSESYLQGRDEHYVARGSRKSATTVPDSEMVGFVSQVLSRLPKLTVLSVWDCHKWPVDWSDMSDIAAPFPALWYAHIRHTPYSVVDLIDFSHRVRGLVDKELRVELDRLPSTADERSVAEECLGKVSFEKP